MEQLSQELFNITDGSVYNQALILNANFEVDPTLLAQQGLVCHIFNLKAADRVLADIVCCSHFTPEHGFPNYSPRTLHWAPPSLTY